MPEDGLNFGEDAYYMIRVYYYSNHIAHIDFPFYHYNLTNENQTTRANRKFIQSQMIKLVKLLEKFFEHKNGNFNPLLSAMKRRRKLYALVDGADEFLRIFPEENKNIFKIKELSFITQTILWLAAHKVIGVAKLYDKIISFIYKR